MKTSNHPTTAREQSYGSFLLGPLCPVRKTGFPHRGSKHSQQPNTAQLFRQHRTGNARGTVRGRNRPRRNEQTIEGKKRAGKNATPKPTNPSSEKAARGLAYSPPRVCVSTRQFFVRNRMRPSPCSASPRSRCQRLLRGGGPSVLDLRVETLKLA